MFLDNRIMTGMKANIVPTMAINVVIRLAFNNSLVITKAAPANAIPTP